MMYTNWLDFQTFKWQESDCNFNEIFYGLSQFVEESNHTLLALGALFLLPFWVAGMISWWFIGPIRAAIRRSDIASNSSDIEETSNDYKITRDQNERYGVCYWHNWYNCNQLLDSRYDLIVGFDYEGFVVCKDGKYGIFNAKKNRMVVPCQSENFHLEYRQVVIERNGKKTTFNQYGERLMS